MDFIEKILALIVVEAIVSDHLKAFIRYVDNHLPKQIKAELFYFNPVLRLMIFIVPGNVITVFVVVSDA